MKKTTAGTGTMSRFYETNPFIPWIIWLLSTVFYLYEFSLQTSIAVMVDDLMHAFKASATALGNLGAMYFYAYSLMQIPVGILLDRLGARKLLTVACLLCAIGCYFFASAKLLTVAAISRFLMGLGSSFAAVSSLHLAATWFPPKRFALLAGVLLSIGMSGAMIGNGPFALLITKLGWRNLLSLLSVIGFVLAAMIWLIIRDHQLASADAKQHQLYETHFLAGIKTVLKSSQAWLIAIYAGLMFAPTLAFGTLWGTYFLSTLYPLSNTMAGTLNSMVFAGWIVGAPFFGWFSDYVGKRRLPFLIGSIGALLSLIIVVYLPHLTVWLLGTSIFCFGFFSSAFLPAFALIRENSPPEANATCMGFVNMLNSFGGAIVLPFIGILLDYFWHLNNGRIVGGIHIYTPKDYQWAISVLPICFVLSLLILPFIKESYCKPIETTTRTPTY